jgi:RimJ/RimL family protein N-acetyltransferase
MTNWITYPTFLSGETVDLIPLEKAHFAELEELAKDKRIWEFYIYDATSSEKFNAIFNSLLEERVAGTRFPFTILHKESQKLIGITQYLDIQAQHEKLEIGTWLHPDYWATEINLECKLLLLTYCFETLKAVRVQLKADEQNQRSRKAIVKIGAQFEGILRNDMIRDNGTFRNSAYYSILASEWEEKKPQLIALYEGKKSRQLRIVMRPALESEAAILSELICENAISTLAPHYSPLQMDTFFSYYSPEAMREKISRQSVFCAWGRGQIIGTIALDDDFVVGFYTRLGFLNQGVGITMMRYLEQFAQEKGLRAIRLSASPVGAAFYYKNGFVKVEDCLFTYLGVSFEETLMRKRFVAVAGLGCQ